MSDLISEPLADGPYKKLILKATPMKIDPIVMFRESLAASIKYGDISPEKLIKIKEILDNA